MAERRSLDFKNWEQVIADLRQLTESGYTKVGKWDLEQIARHLKDWISFPIEGFPSPPLPIRLVLTAMQYAFGRRLFKKILATGKMASGGPTLGSTVYKRSSNDAEAVADLESAIERFRQYNAAIHPSPLFGPMDKPAAERLQLIHFAHHLSFLIPN